MKKRSNFCSNFTKFLFVMSCRVRLLIICIFKARIFFSNKFEDRKKPKTNKTAPSHQTVKWLFLNKPTKLIIP